MFKNLMGLLGAGGISGLLSFAPWIIAGIVALGGVGGWFWQGHQLDVANKATAAAALERDAANTKVGMLQGALDTSNLTITELKANEAANDQLIAEYEHQQDEDARASVDAGNQIRNLQNDDATVAAYLALPIPCGLRAVLNGPSRPGATTGGADKDGACASPETVTVPGTTNGVQKQR